MSLLVLIAHIRILAVDKMPYLDFFIISFLDRIIVPFFLICSGYFLFKSMDLNKPDFKKIRKYILRMCKMYLIWSLIYLPLNIYNYIQEIYYLLAHIHIYGIYLEQL